MRCRKSIGRSLVGLRGEGWHLFDERDELQLVDALEDGLVLREDARDVLLALAVRQYLLDRRHLLRALALRLLRCSGGGRRLLLLLLLPAGYGALLNH